MKLGIDYLVRSINRIVSARRTRPSRAPAMESLEARTLMSATFDSGTGILTITGTEKADQIALSAGVNAGEVVVDEAPDVDAGTLFTGVNAVVINSLGGSDHIEVGNGLTDSLAAAMGVSVDAGNGNDHIEGGSGNDTLLGGKGNDQISDKSGDNSVDGGDGNDKLTTGGGMDTVLGGKGNDNISAGAGTDSIDAGDGNDKIVGGSDADTIVAGTGKDNIKSDDLDDVDDEDGAPVTDTEPNDDTSTATPIGNVGDGSERDISGTVNTSSDTDFFSFTLGIDASVELKVQATGGQPVTVDVLASDGTTVLGTIVVDPTHGSSKGKDEFDLLAGSYFLRVTTSAASPADYLIEMEVEA